MSRFVFLACLLSLVVVSVGWTQNQPNELSRKQLVALKAKFRVALQSYSRNHPKAIALRKQISALEAILAEQEQEFSHRLLTVIAKNGVAVTLKNARIRSLGGRSFLVGVETKNPQQITKLRFDGKVIWIPVDGVTQMIEVNIKKQTDNKK
ncbi:MAG: hypothetical protein ACFCD0_28055 [Gemmataceae bacterium]